MTAIIFPGQGSQYIGMAKDFFDNFLNAKLVFEEIEDFTSIDVKKIIFEDKLNQLNLTNYTQLCIFTASCSIFKVIETEFDLNQFSINTMLGHSLGEYTALVCSHKIKLSDCSKLLKLRGKLMNEAIQPNKSGMAALIGVDCVSVQNIIDKENLNVQIANDNSPLQVVISGMINNIDKSRDFFLQNGVKKFVKLNVSSAFHSNLMIDAQNIMKKHINEINFYDSQFSIISNYSSNISKDSLKIKDSLVNQMANKVRWTESVKELEKTKENNIIEIGPGKVLSGLVRRICNSFEITSIDQINDLELLNNYEFSE